MSVEAGRLASVRESDLVAQNERLQELLSCLDYVSNVFEGFFLDDLSPDLMRSVSFLAHRAVSSMVVTEGEMAANYTSAMLRQLQEADAENARTLAANRKAERNAHVD